MATAAQMRKLALALPDVEEKSHFEQPDFRVRNKIFAGLSRDQSEGTLKLTPELQALVLSSRPNAFFAAAGFWGRSGWTKLTLSEVPAAELGELLRESYALVAPKRASTAQKRAAAKTKAMRKGKAK